MPNVRWVEICADRLRGNYHRRRANRGYAGTTSSGDQDLVNRTAATFLLTRVTASSNAQVTASAGNTANPDILPGNTDKNTLKVSAPWRQNVTLSFSYRDQATQQYGCDFKLVVSYLGNAGADNYYLNYYAFPVETASGPSVNCSAETGYEQTVAGTGASLSGVWFIK